MFVVYSWENPNSLNKVYISRNCLTLDINKALWWNSIDDIYAHKAEIVDSVKGMEPTEWFIGELEPTCRAFFGEF